MTPDLGIPSDVAAGLLTPPSGTPPRAARSFESPVPVLWHVPLRMLRDGAVGRLSSASGPAAVAPLSAFGSAI
jgi:hypothetical protein